MKKILIALLLVCICGCVGVRLNSSETFKLNLIHTNDLHAHLLPFNDLKDCSLDSDCLGGFARIISFMKQEKTPRTLILDAGDRFTGTAFYTLLKSKPLLPLFQKMPYDAVTLGNHEFDDNLPETVAFLKQWSVPVVVANLKMDPQEELSELVRPAVILEKENRKIGVIGVLTTETVVMDNHAISVLPYTEVIAHEIDSLKKQGINIIIVLSHIGLDADKELARAFPDIDIIVGGHSHSLLSNDASVPFVSGPYPISMNQGKTLIVSTGKGGHFVGKLEAEFNATGEIVKYQGNTVPMTQQIPNDPEAKQWIQKVQEEIRVVLSEKITVLETPLGFTPGTNYCSEGCLVGEYLAETLHSAYPTVDGVLLNSGSIRRGFPAGDISYSHLIDVYPFDNAAVFVQMTGKELKDYLEHGIAHYHQNEKTNEMLQTAGVKYLFSKENKKITHVEVKGEKLEMDKRYTLLMSSFLADGGDGYPPLSSQKTGFTIREILKKQMKIFVFKRD